MAFGRHSGDFYSGHSAFFIVRFTLRSVRINMSKASRDGLYLFLLGSLVAVLLGSVLSRTSPVAVVDFRVVYYPARCLILHCDPYSESEVLQLVHTEGGGRPSGHGNANHFARYLYLPSAFFSQSPLRCCLGVWRIRCGSDSSKVG